MSSVDRQQRAEELRDTAHAALDWFAGQGRSGLQYQNWTIQRDDSGALGITNQKEEPILSVKADGQIHSYNHFLAQDLAQDLRGQTVDAIARTMLGAMHKNSFTSSKHGYQIEMEGGGLELTSQDQRTLLRSQATPSGVALDVNIINQNDLSHFHDAGMKLQQIMSQHQQGVEQVSNSEIER